VRIKRLVACGTLCTIFGLLMASNAFGHQQGPGVDSVDTSGRRAEIRWREESRYDDAIVHANNAWNALLVIVIAPDTTSTVQDLEWKDASRCDVTWVGQWVWNPGADNINMNTCKMSGWDPKEVAGHELGHALGLAHSFAGELMVATGTCNCLIPQSHDEADYYARWGEPTTVVPGGDVPCSDLISAQIIDCPI